MCRQGTSHGVRWCQSLRVDPGHSRPVFSDSTLAQADSRPPASPSWPAFLLGKTSSQMASFSIGYVSLWYRTRLRIPDLRRILGDGAVTGELPGAGQVQDDLARPALGIGVEREKSAIRFEIGGEIRQMHVVIAVGQ